MIKIGYMEYANVYPIFHYLLRDKSLEFIKSYPSVLNVAMRNGEIDLSPASCIEYARNPHLYKVIRGLSISSIGAVKSVNIFSDYKIEDLSGKKIYFTKESNTSTVLTRIVLEKFYDLMPIYTNDDKDFNAELLIGDKALHSYYNTKKKYVIDLGKEWYNFTNLPFVFALWIARKDITENNDFKSLTDKLRSYALKSSKDFKALSEKYIQLGYSSEQMIDYWNTINYELTDNHIKGLKLFFDLAYQIGETSNNPNIEFC